MTHNKCHPISHEGDVDWIAHTVDEETTVIAQHDYPPTNNIDSAPKDTYDLGHGSLQVLKKSQKRLILHILRLLVNLKNKNATETCAEIHVRDIINIYI
ncbi:unnamed protein product, partial [Rotaria socialis]